MSFQRSKWTNRNNYRSEQVFLSLTKLPRTGKIIIWDTVTFKPETYFEGVMNNTPFHPEKESVQLSNKILAMFATDNQSYWLFINN